MLLQFAGMCRWPQPLQMAWTFDARQALGGSQSIALLFRNEATHAIPFALICFNNWSGIWLNPELLFALKANCRVCVSSSGVICCVVGFVTGAYSASGTLVSWKSARLWSAKSLSLSAVMSWSLCLSSFQNCLGWYFMISGSYSCSFVRFRSQHFLQSLYACNAGGLDLP